MILDERFWAKVDCSGDDGECWNWTGAKSSTGYGHFTRDMRTHLSHRELYIAAVGPIPYGALILHSCDNRACVNPAHLRAGTPQDNMDDRTIRGRVNRWWEDRTRIKRGEAHRNAKITFAIAAEMRAMRVAGVTGRAVAAHFGVTPALVSNVWRGKRWVAADA